MTQNMVGIYSRAVKAWMDQSTVCILGKSD